MLLFAAIIGYIAGSIPSGLLLVKVLLGKDIRASGSGNIGATNAVRVGGKYIGAATFFLDATKGLLAIYLVRFLYTDIPCAQAVAGFWAVLGHMFPVWLHFKGGKGVATSLAVVGFFSPISMAVGVLTWMGVFSISRISSLASLAMMPIMGVTILFFDYERTSLHLVIAVSMLVFVKHSSNIKRLISRQESKF